MSVLNVCDLILALIARMGASKVLVQILSFIHELYSFSSGHLLQELVSEENSFTPSDVERALWSSAIGLKLKASKSNQDSEIKTTKNSKRKRKH